MMRTKTRPSRPSSLVAATGDAGHDLLPIAPGGQVVPGTPTADVEPDVVTETRRRLAALNPAVVVEGITDACVAVAYAAHRRSTLLAARQALSDELAGLLGADDVDWRAAAEARSRVAAMDDLATTLPPVGVPEDIGTAALAHAVSQLHRNVTVRTPAYVRERRTWEQLSEAHRAHPANLSPTPLTSDRDAVALVQRLRRDAEQIAQGVASIAGQVGQRQVDVLALMQSASDYMPLIDDLEKRAAEADKRVLTADALRSAAGATWTQPANWLPTTTVPNRTDLLV